MTSHPIARTRISRRAIVVVTTTILWAAFFVWAASRTIIGAWNGDLERAREAAALGSLFVGWLLVDTFVSARRVIRRGRQ